MSSVGRYDYPQQSQYVKLWLDTNETPLLIFFNVCHLLGIDGDFVNLGTIFSLFFIMFHSKCPDRKLRKCALNNYRWKHHSQSFDCFISTYFYNSLDNKTLIRIRNVICLLRLPPSSNIRSEYGSIPESPVGHASLLLRLVELPYSKNLSHHTAIVGFYIVPYLAWVSLKFFF